MSDRLLDRSPLTCPPVPEQPELQQELQQEQPRRSPHQPMISCRRPIPSQPDRSSAQTTSPSRYLLLTACSSTPSSSYWEPLRKSARSTLNRSRASSARRRGSHGHQP